MVVTLASARGMTVDDYGLELRKQWSSESNGLRAMLIVAEQRSSVSSSTRCAGADGHARLRGASRSMRDFPGGACAARARRLPLRRRASSSRDGTIAVPATAEFPALSGRVVDDAGVLDASTRAALRAKLAAHEAQDQHQIVVATVKSLNGNSIEDYANRLFRRWRLGQRGKNNGVLLLHAPTERKIRIEVGYGLEGTLTDAIAKYIIQNSITPRFKANDFAGGMTRGVDDIIKVLSGDAEEFKQRAEPRQSGSGAGQHGSPFLMVVMLVIVIVDHDAELVGLHALLAGAGSPGRGRKRALALGRQPVVVGGSSGLVVVGSSVAASSSELERQFFRRRRRFRRRRFVG